MEIAPAMKLPKAPSPGPAKTAGTAPWSIPEVSISPFHGMESRATPGGTVENSHEYRGGRAREGGGCGIDLKKALNPS